MYIEIDLKKKKKNLLNKEIINIIPNANREGGNAQRVKMADGTCESVFV